MSTAHWSTQDTPIGPFTAVVAADGAVLGSGWTADPGELVDGISPALRPTELVRRRDLGPVSKAVRRYHQGELDAIDLIPVRQRSGEFLQHAWDVLRTIPAGKPQTYSDFAALAGRPSAIRGAALACARNAAALFVPCHRVYRIGGALGGFRWGLDVKRWLLDHEAAVG
ncbi:methylated-DNA--[protein]-cysteine S-methyltransferase [Prauserella endophytica]|uniref:Methylated-DNA--[protein]-cysteine S-methyltransferase n=1 Tax=Prauserella endophytica TaxID=1592324 RepID=A0ABY2RUN7_9PSEU|nr:methylated-DNA--[protein]-cysteine S-methyltransferase [Prauserella endophytica]TKG61320.1 methylated-DNA--[protein]-cysteine S-methyltransferase [Prauserella endophytica]